MYNYNTFIYQIKEGLFNFFSKIGKLLGRVESKFISSMIYGIVKSASPMLSEIGRSLKEKIKLIDTVDRLSKNLAKIYKYLDIVWNNYHKEIKPKLKSNSLMSFDFSDVIKPLGKKFEDIVLVPDGSDEHKLKMGYWVAEATVLINDRVVSLYSTIFSTLSKGFKSTNDIAFKILDKIYTSFGNIRTFVMNRGIVSYYKKWRIEEYFKYKKQQFDFEKFRVRDLERINSLNTLMTLALSGLEIITRQKSKLLLFILEEAKPIKQTVYFELYRLAYGVKAILSHSITGITAFFSNLNPPNITQLSLFDYFAET